MSVLSTHSTDSSAVFVAKQSPGSLMYTFESNEHPGRVLGITSDEQIKAVVSRNPHKAHKCMITVCSDGTNQATDIMHKQYYSSCQANCMTVRCDYSGLCS